MLTFFGPRGNSKRRVGTHVHTTPSIVLGKRGVPLNCHRSRVGGRQAIFYLAWQPRTRAAGVCRPLAPAAACGVSTVTTLSRGDPLCGFPMSVLGCGICLSHPYRTSLSREVLNFHFYAHSDPIPDGHFRAMSGAAAGPVFYTTFPAPDMARKRTLGKLTIEPVDVGGPKLAKPWVHCPMGIVSLAGVVRALWASSRDILGRCGTSVRGRFGPVSETIRGPQALCCTG